MMDKNRDFKQSRFYRIRSIRLNKPLLNSIFIGALFILSTISVLSYFELKNLIESNRWVIHTHTVLNSLDEALYALSSLESDQRGYLVTNDTAYLQEMDATKTVLNTNLEKLEELTKDNAEQSKRISRFISLTNERLDFLSKVAHLKPSTELFKSEGIALFNKSNALSDKVKALAQEIKSVELVLLSDRNIKLLNKADASTFLFLIGSFISMILLFIPFLLANFELINRQIIEFKNRNIKAYLRQIIETTDEMIAALDEKGCFRIFNEAYQLEFKQLFDKSLIVGMHVEEAFENISDEKNELANLWKRSDVV